MRGQARSPNSTQSCPTIELLKGFVQSAELPSPELSAHLEACSNCQGAVEHLQAQATLSLVKVSRQEPEFGSTLDFLRRIEEPMPRPQPSLKNAPAIPGMEIEAVLGQGGMGIVYLAKQTALARHVAVKTIRVGHGSEPQFLSRFRREALALAALTHENIVRAYDFGERDGVPYLVMEYVSGRTLRKEIREHRLSPCEAAELVTVLACAVDYAHSKGIVHRDLKPGNVLISPDGTPKIADFGLARLRDTAATTETLAGGVGTPCYMAPEQAAGGENVGPPADIYALGGILYEMLCLQPPFSGTDVAEILHTIQHRDPVSPRLICPQIPRDLETICLKCLQKLPSARYASALALADDLKAFIDTRPIAARPLGPVSKSLRLARSRMTFVTFVTLVVLITFGGAITAFVALTGVTNAHQPIPKHPSGPPGLEPFADGLAPSKAHDKAAPERGPDRPTEVIGSTENRVFPTSDPSPSAREDAKEARAGDAAMDNSGAAEQVSKLEGEFERDMQQIQGYLCAFTSDGYTLRPDGTKGPASFALIEGEGALTPTRDGLAKLVALAHASRDRPRGPIPYITIFNVGQAPLEPIETAQALLRKYGSLMVEKGLLAP